MLKPLGDRVILEVTQEEEKTVGGLVLASAAKEKPQTAKVVAVGEGNVLENGQKSPMPVAVGDMVMFGNEYLIIAAKDIMAIVE